MAEEHALRAVTTLWAIGRRVGVAEESAEALCVLKKDYWYTYFKSSRGGGIGRRATFRA